MATTHLTPGPNAVIHPGSIVECVECREYCGVKSNPTPRNPVLEAIQEIERLHRKKSADYANSSNIFSNFDEAAAQSGLTSADTLEVMLGIKTARIKNLRSKAKNGADAPQNEPLLDSYLDRAVYAIIAYANAKENGAL